MIKKSKGIKKSTFENKITFDDYEDCLFNKTNHYTTMNLIRSSKHEIHSVE